MALDVPSLIAGSCAKGVRASLEEHSMAWLENLGSTFRADAYGVFVYWDDDGDRDGTQTALRGWARRNRQIHLVLAPPLRAPNWYRTQRLALCRNVLLGEGLLRLPAHGTLAFYDLDCKVASTAPALAAARMLAQSHSPWSVLTANSPGAYYDQWALRSAMLGLDYDCQFAKPAATRAGCKDMAILLHPQAAPFGVQSAFNGLAVYHVGALARQNATGCRFEGSRMSRICEHVPFSLCLGRHGLRLAVLPQMVVNCGAPPLRGAFERAKVQARLFANNSLQLLEYRHRMPMYTNPNSKAEVPRKGPKPPKPAPFEQWSVAGARAGDASPAPA